MAVGFPTKVNYATGDVLSATNMNDLSGTVNLLESAQYAAGKNKIINGDFGVWQRGTTFTNPAASAYNADRFYYNYGGTGATRTISQQTFTPGTAPVAGYEGTFFWRMAQTVAGSGSTYDVLVQPIEDVRTFAGQTVTVSFWAKAASPTNATPFLAQNFGTGGSSTVNNQMMSGTGASITTSWTRFTGTAVIPSISGKTIGTNSKLEFQLYFQNNVIQTIDIWGVQVEAASTASPFQTATGTKQGELAACQRYYWRATVSATANRLGLGYVSTATEMFNFVQFPVEMRTTPTALEQSGTASDYSIAANILVTTCSAVPTLQQCTKWNATSVFTVASGLVAGQAAVVRAANTNAYLGWSAEL